MLVKPKKKKIASPKTNTTYDVFLSHAWQDKNSFADSLARELINQGFSVWYDTDTIKWGESIRAKIDGGLLTARTAIVILSSSYTAEEKYWTRYELDGLIQLESKGRIKLLFVWHNITHDEVLEYGPSIAGRLALRTDQVSPCEMAKQLRQLI